MGLVVASAVIAAVLSLVSPLEAAVVDASAQAQDAGVTAHVAVVDRATGQIVARTANADAQVQSESIMKLFLAADRTVRGLPVDPDLVTLSEDGLASAYFTPEAIPRMVARYGLSEQTTNAQDYAGHWGAARITADDMALFLHRALADPAVGSTLSAMMTSTTDTASDGFDQSFGMNAIEGAGSKQGWGLDGWAADACCAVQSVGFTDRYTVAILQTADWYDTRTMRRTATQIAQAVVTAAPPPLPAPASARRPARGGLRPV